MPKRPSNLTGAAGAYYVASRLATQGLHAALTVGNAPNVDIIVSLIDGKASLALQVKTTDSALRTRGRGNNKIPHHYEWEIGKSAKSHHSGLFFALVDLKRGKDELPDVFIIPSEILSKWYLNTVNKYFNGNEELWVRKRFHPKVETIEQYRNDWQILKDYLNKISF